MKNIIAYTLSGCSHCVSLKELFRRSGVEYSELVVKRDVSIQEFHNQYPGINSFPYVVIDEAPIGGLVETVKLFVQQGLITSSKKQNGNS